MSLTKGNVEFDYNTFKKEKLLWNSSKPANYQFKLEYDIYGSSNNGSISANTLIVVENGVYKTQIPKYTIDEDGYTSRSYRNETITDIYEYIEREYKKFHKNRPGSVSSYLTEIEIEYDTRNHIPVEVKLHYYCPTAIGPSQSGYDEIYITEYKVND
jgi:hypothetical protein